MRGQAESSRSEEKIVIYFVFHSLNRKFDFRRRYSRSEKKRKTSFSFAFLSLNRIFANGNKTKTLMSTATLTNLRDYLYGTLTPANMIWLANQLTEYAEKEGAEYSLKPLTMQEIDAMLDEAEADFDAGLGIPHEEVMRKWKERVACEKKPDMAEAV